MASGDQPNVTRQADAVEVRWADGAASVLPNLWLRDNCGCDECRFHQTTEKVFVVASVPVDLRPTEIELIDDKLRITWPGGHISCYTAADIRAFETDDVLSWTPWKAEFEPARTDYHGFLSDNNIAAKTIADFLECGACILTSAPVIPDTLEALAPRLGPIHEVLFDRIHNVKVDLSGYNIAYSARAIPPHNDFASYTWPPSVQALHMLVNDTPGGESIIVDGWNVLNDLRQEQPALFETLCAMPVPFREFDADNETYVVAPIVRMDTKGEIVGLRYSNQLMQAMNPGTPELGLFYRAYHELCRRLTDPAVHASFRLQAGEILLLASHRVLHGRNAFEPAGKRHLQDAYFELDNVRNHRVVLQRKSEH